MANQPSPQVPAPYLDKFVAELRALAQKYRINVLAVAGVDPSTNAQRVYVAKEHIPVLADVVAERFGLFNGGETEWTA